MKKTFAGIALGGLMALSGSLYAADYAIDKEGQHAFINFKTGHMGFSVLHGRFNDFDGSFSWDAENPENSKVNVVINTTSVDSNHAERDKHLRSPDFLNVGKHPQATFVSTDVEVTGENTAKVTGDFTFNGVTKPVVIDARFIGEGQDPWGGYRAGFEGTTSIKLADYNVSMDLGPASAVVELDLTIEGVRK
ncbi:MAG: YceI family protein [Pseudomonas sp.]